MAQTAETLHVTNGDSVLYSFRKAGLVGTQIAWRDVLNEGPVPAGLSLEQLSRVRANYLASRGYGHAIKIHREFEQRDSALRKAADFDEVILWFEHDLFDQLQLLQILHVLTQMTIPPSHVSLVQSDQYLGPLEPSELLALLPKRRIVSDATIAMASGAWEAFTASNPRGLSEIAATDRVGLPFLRRAFARLCEEFPGRDGLSRSQRQALNAVVRGAAVKEELFRRSQAQEEASFLGDSGFYAILNDLAIAQAPLIEEDDGLYEATALGQRILAGDGDWLEVAPLERHIGGVHLTNKRPWRFDEVKRSFIDA
jgi:hypothetical protein